MGKALQSGTSPRFPYASSDFEAYFDKKLHPFPPEVKVFVSFFIRAGGGIGCGRPSGGRLYLLPLSRPSWHYFVMSFDIPKSMQAELQAWNNGKGIDLQTWVSCEGNFRLAVGYAAIFWPKFVEFEDYIFLDGFSVEALRGFEAQEGITRKSVEWVINHLHIADIQYYGCPDISRDKLVLIGKTLKEIYEVKLKFCFPRKPCIVEFYQPEDPENLVEYQLSFWQAKHEISRV